MPNHRKKPLILIIRDGWGHGKHYKGNAVWIAHTPNHDFYKQNYPTTVLKCTGQYVGNPPGFQGGSEVGHLTIGAGRIVWQPLEFINKAIRDGSFYSNKVLLGAIENCKKHNSKLHISGLFSDAGVHSTIKHAYAIMDMAKRHGIKEVYMHAILDGRDVHEKSAKKYVKMFEYVSKKIGIGKIATLNGRYYAMDRDKNWDRTKKAYELIVEAKGHRAKDAVEGIEHAYQYGDKTDYYVRPIVIVNENNEAIAVVKKHDSFVFFNFRSDRARQITSMLTGKSKLKVKDLKLHYVCMCEYEHSFNLPVAFMQKKVPNNLGNVIAKNNLKQLRIAETEKYAHITFFFNSQVDKPNKGESRIMIPSPKVPSYDMKPEMSAFEVKKKVLEEIKKDKFDFIVLNFANADLVGHSGVFTAAVKACEVVDKCVGQIVKEILKRDGIICLMADHGNSDHMINNDGSVDPSHGFNPVLFTLISNDKRLKKVKLREGSMKDVAPTVLQLLRLRKPLEMRGESLIVR